MTNPMSEHEALHSLLAPSVGLESTESYLCRLSTYTEDPTRYFAKPLAISPFICARFGWTNTSRDILQCSKCNGCICIVFNDKLEANSYRKLALEYRKMLATCHSQDCPFWIDARRWLIDDDGNGSCRDTNQDTNQDLPNKSTIMDLQIPPFLINMSPEFTPFEDCSDDGFISRDFIQTEVKKSIKVFQQYNISARRIFGISIPIEVVDFVKSYVKKASASGINSDIWKDGNEDSVKRLLISLLHEQDSNESEGQAIHNRSKEMDFLTELSILLSTFGWRPYEEKEHTSPQCEHLYVRCPLCMSCVPLIKRSLIEGEDAQKDQDETADGNDNYNKNRSIQQPTKRARRDEEAPVDCSSAGTFHLLKSHRHSCPYYSGFTDESKAGWKTILSSILKQYSTSDMQNCSRPDRMEMMYRSIRSRLQSS